MVELSLDWLGAFTTPAWCNFSVWFTCIPKTSNVVVRTRSNALLSYLLNETKKWRMQTLKNFRKIPITPRLVSCIDVSLQLLFLQTLSLPFYPFTLSLRQVFPRYAEHGRAHSGLEWPARDARWVRITRWREVNWCGCGCDDWPRLANCAELLLRLWCWQFTAMYHNRIIG